VHFHGDRHLPIAGHAQRNVFQSQLGLHIGIQIRRRDLAQINKAAPGKTWRARGRNNRAANREAGTFCESKSRQQRSHHRGADEKLFHEKFSFRKN
jgi:hypothetical protein